MSLINPNNKKMVLSCDGGGIRGIIIARCLEKLEQIEGKPCNQIFSLMTGTSTGAIIAGALARGMKASDLVNIYLNRGREIFRKTYSPYDFVFKWTYSKKGSRKVFQDIYGDCVLQDLPVDILISAKDTVRGETMFFEKHKTFGNMLLREAVESSMSAPTYFRPNGRYIDGGIGSFNNPCYQAALEAVHYLKYPKGNISMLSFGCGRDINNMKEGEAEKKPRWGWIDYVIGGGMDDANEQQVDQVKREYVSTGALEFKRYQLSFSHDVFAQIGVPIDKVGNVRKLKMNAVKRIEALDLIARQFAKRVTFTEKEGLELGAKPKLVENDYKQYLKNKNHKTDKIVLSKL